MNTLNISKKLFKELCFIETNEDIKNPKPKKFGTTITIPVNDSYTCPEFTESDKEKIFNFMKDFRETSENDTEDKWFLTFLANNKFTIPTLIMLKGGKITIQKYAI